MHVRFARHTDRLAALTEFYRDVIGLRRSGGFEDHDGYDGVFFDLPGTEAHLEFTSGGAHAAPVADPETLLVLYLGSQDAVEAILERAPPTVEAANPYWNANAVTIVDPDGFHIVLVPGDP